MRMFAWFRPARRQTRREKLAMMAGSLFGKQASKKRRTR